VGDRAILSLCYLASLCSANVQKGSARTARRAEITSKQAAYFETKIVEKGKTAQVLPSVVFSSVGKELLSTPTPVKKPEQLVPASPTAQALQGQSNPPAQ